MQAVVNWLSGRVRSFSYAFAGLWVVLAQQNTRLHLISAIGVIVAGLLWQLSQAEWLAIVLTISLVLCLEAINTSLEAIVDLVSPRHHPLAARAKDVGAAAVLIAAVGAVGVALLIFGPRIWHLFRLTAR
ncbi:MAG: diacylglycerol kinase family protein [Herpetosiphon sp.]